MKITIIGSGNMARGIGTRLLAGGHSVALHAKEMEKARALATELGRGARRAANVEVKPVGEKLDGDVVILAIPYTSETSVIKQYRDQLAGKILVDISNPVDFQTFELLPPPGSSAAQEAAKLVPKDTKVVKAFNTTLAGTLVEGKVAGQPLDVFIAGDDREAKATIAQLVIDGGMRPLDVGPLSRAHHLEALQVIQFAAQDQIKANWMSAVKLIS